ncbi:choice-of-anchor Q domain-containing protein [Fretibacterium sp. OH1220_COT-178]|uniref:choice-of-anchor Q domain-containing protein n=1 Tax=Fretibacterium sp. OH1220_COT-178 TaxID=2491047 RepID=UPI000F6010FD|nr:choice-of-anchor Q domain-containing protein [Fretibacterium sp. OH1220_COT-178]RRD65511.1 hypothetical protein EII26_03900 [Fretibacterium sp. OH1220_COT-178]
MVGCRMNVKKTALAMLAICFAFASPGDAKVYHVNASAVASGDGNSWSAPLDEAGFAAALNGAASGDEFWIAAGSYRPVVPASTDAVTAAEQGKSFTLRDGVALYGGFSGSERTREQRNPDRHAAVLTGDLALDDVRDAQGVTLSADVIQGKNSKNVLKAANAKGVRLDGIVVSGGDQGVGAGLSLGRSDMVIQNCLFQGNRAVSFGGGINAVASSLDIRSSRFLENRGGPNSHGGAVNSVQTNLRIVDSSFENNRTGSDTSGNKAGNGGAVQFSDKKGGDKTLSVEGCRFRNNFAGAGGGGLYVQNAGTDVTVRGSLFKGNRTAHNGGAVRFSTSTNILVESCLFEDNATVIEGGAIYNSEVGSGDRGMTIRACTFSGNRTYDDVHVSDPNKGSGGAVYNGVSSPTIVNCTFTDNGAKYGGALFNRTGSYPLLINCTFLGNRARAQGGEGGEGSSVYNTGCTGGVCKPGGGRIVAFNSIFWDDGTGEIVSNGDSGAALYRSIVRGGAVRGGAVALSEVASDDPQLSPPGSHGGAVPTCPPAWGSPARDRGRSVGALTSADVVSADVFWRDWTSCAVPAVDARGIARPQFAGVDIGAVELSSAPQPAPGPNPTPAPRPEPQPKPKPKPQPNPEPKPEPKPIQERPITEAPVEAPIDAGYDAPGAWRLSVGEVGIDGTAEVSIEVRLKPVPRRLSRLHVETRNFVEASTSVFLNGTPVSLSSSVRGESPAGLYEYVLKVRGRVRGEALDGTAEQRAALTALTYRLEGDESPTRLKFGGDGVPLSAMKREAGGGSGCDSGVGVFALMLAVFLARHRLGRSS